MKKLYIYLYNIQKNYFLLFFLLSVSLTSCSTTQLAVNVLKNAKKEIEQPDINKARLGPGGIYKIGNPYVINGVRYIPKLDLSYDKTGIASWYGKAFHGKRTANGEIYNMNALTAAHKTLPLNTIVRVTNLSNNKSLILRINDRGPYVKGRILDCSYGAAKKLDFISQGTTDVKVEVIEWGDNKYMKHKK